jgi:hypothetical protein
MIRCALVACLGLAAAAASAADPCRSGLKPEQRPGPYASLVAVGPQRGQQHCFICETAQRPAVIIFARNLSEPLGKLVKGIDRAVIAAKKAELRSWVTFLTDEPASLDPHVVQWSKQHALSNVPLGIYDDAVGPPTYLLAREADVTVLLAVKQKVVATFAYRAGELNDTAGAEVLRAVTRLVDEKK